MDTILFEYLSPPFIGGLLLLVGALLISEKGKIYEASILYLIADLCWIITSYKAEGLNIGTIMVILGTLIGIRTFYKMHKNIYFRNLNTEKKDDLDSK